MSTRDVQVRRAESIDLDDVVALSADWAAEGITYGMTAESREWFESRLRNYFYVAEGDRKTIGFAQGEVRTSDERVAAVLPAGAQFVEVTYPYVRPEWRSRSIGSRLLAAVLDAAAAEGVQRSMLFTGAKDTHAAIRFYEHHGFRSWGVQLVR